MRFPVPVLLLAVSGAVSAQAPAPPRMVMPGSTPVQVGTVGVPDSTLQTYLRARQQLNMGAAREAAEAFAGVARARKEPAGIADALYWQAFALYRLGTQEDLQKARGVLENQRRQLDLAEKRARADFDDNQRKTHAQYSEQLRESQAQMDKQRRDSRKQFEKERAQTAATLEQQRKEALAAFEAQQTANNKFLAEQEENNRQSLVQLDERRKQALAGYEEESQRIRKNYEEQQKRNRNSKAVVEALERQRELMLKALDEQRNQTQTQFEAQRRQFTEAYERQREQTRTQLERQQANLDRSLAVREQDNKRILEGIERRNQQQLQAVERGSEMLRQRLEREQEMTRAGRERQLGQIASQFAARRQESLRLSQWVAGSLAESGDRSAARELRKALKPGELCADEAQISVRLETMNAMVRVEPDAVRPVLLQIFEPKNKCSRPIRERAVFMLSLQQDQPAADILIKVARTDPEVDVRQQALASMRRSPLLAQNSVTLVKLYDQFKERQLKQQLIVLYGQSRTPQATEKLISIVRNEQDAGLRQQSIAILGGPRDPRVQEALRENQSAGTTYEQ